MNNLKKLKVMTILGTRPEIIRLSCVIAKLDQYCDHILVHTGQNYDFELNEVFFQDLKLKKPKHFLNAAGENAAQTIGQIIISIDKGQHYFVFFYIFIEPSRFKGDKLYSLNQFPSLG